MCNHGGKVWSPRWQVARAAVPFCKPCYSALSAVLRVRHAFASLCSHTQCQFALQLLLRFMMLTLLPLSSIPLPFCMLLQFVVGRLWLLSKGLARLTMPAVQLRWWLIFCHHLIVWLHPAASVLFPSAHTCTSDVLPAQACLQLHDCLCRSSPELMGEYAGRSLLGVLVHILRVLWYKCKCET
jgi:hypothetical protein